MLSEQVQKRERLKLEQTKKQKAYLEMIFYPLEYVIRPVLNQFMEIDRKKLFLNHVTTDEAADYHKIIKQPMCFSEIYQKLANHAYATLDQFKNDVRLIWTNSMDYNTSDTSFYKVASKLQNASQKLFDSAQDKLSRYDMLQDGTLDEQIDDALFTYDASFEEDDLVDQDEHPPVQVVDTKEETRLKAERERVKAEKEAEHQRAIRARVEGRAKARALREENRRKGILPPVDPVEQQIKSRTLRKLRDRGNSALAVSASSLPHQDLVTNVASNDCLAHLPFQPLASVNDDNDTQMTPVEATMEEEEEEQQQQQPPVVAQPVKHTAEQVNDLKVEQSVDASAVLSAPSNSLIAHVSPSSTTVSDSPLEDSLSAQENKAEKEEQESSASSTQEKQKDITAMPAKRKHASARGTRRLTRSNGLQASLEELTKRPKISHEARTLYASYNGVSHLDRPHEVYKENRKKHAPVGWVWLKDDDDDDDDDNDDDDEEGEDEPNDKREESMDADDASTGETGSTKKHARLGRNDIPVPGFNKGEIVWARVNKYPSHPAKVSFNHVSFMFVLSVCTLLPSF